MVNFNRIVTLLEGVKNAVIILGIPILGVYIWNYHKTQVELKDSIIELQQAQLSQAKEFGVESAHQKLVAMKNLYETLLEDANDSLSQKSLLLDSLSRALNTNDTTARQFGRLVVIPEEMLNRFVANRIVVDDLLRECRAEKRVIIEQLKRVLGEGELKP